MLDVFRQPSHRDFRAIHIAVRIDCHTFSSRTFGSIGLMTGNEKHDVAVLGASDSHTLPPARVVRRVRLRINGIENVTAINVETANTAELFPLFEKPALLVEDLDSHVSPVGHEQAPARVES